MNSFRAYGACNVRALVHMIIFSPEYAQLLASFNVILFLTCYSQLY